jgi:hypothetical protein
MGHGLPPVPADDLGDPIVVDTGTSPITQSPPPVVIGLDAKTGNAKGSPASIADRIVSFARRNLGARVDDGECFALADRALRGAGAKSARDFGTVTPDADYVWGQSVNLSQLQRGDIIQFRDYQSEVETRTPTEVRTETQSRPHHTAIVESVAGGGAVNVIEQNIPEGTGVTRSRLHFTSGTTGSGDTTTTVAVQGQFWFYRPQAR